MCGSRLARSPPRSSPRADLSRAATKKPRCLAGLFCFCVSAPGLYDGGNKGKNVRVDLFDFELPEERIALRPAEPRESARLLVVAPEKTRDAHVFDLPAFLRPGDVLVVNDAKVIPAQLFGARRRGETVARIDATLHKREDDSHWRAFVRPAKKLRIGETIRVGGPDEGAACQAGALSAVVVEKNDGECLLAFNLSGPFLDEAILAHGHMPLPPYIAARRKEDARDARDYQTLFAENRARWPRRRRGCISRRIWWRRQLAPGPASKKSLCWSGRALSCRSRRRIRQDHVMHSEWGEDRLGDGGAAQCGAGGRGPHFRGRHHVLAHSGERGRRGGRIEPFAETRHFYYAGLSIQGGGRADDQFPPAALDPVHAGLRSSPDLSACSRPMPTP